MSPTTAEVLDSARALPREGRAEIVQELLSTLAIPDSFDKARLAALRDAVAAAEASIAAGRFERVTADEMRDYVRQIGQGAVADVDVPTP